MSATLFGRTCLRCPLFAFSPEVDAHILDYRCDSGTLRQKNPGFDNPTRNVHYPPRPCHVLFVGEAPGEQESAQGLPFIGPAGKVLRKAILRVYGTDSPWVRGIANVVRCRPPGNRAPTDLEISACLPRLVREITKRKPRLIVALGSTALRVLCERSGVRALCGRKLPCAIPRLGNFPIISCVHPSYVLRSRGEMPLFEAAIARSKEVLENLDRRSKRN